MCHRLNRRYNRQSHVYAELGKLLETRGRSAVYVKTKRSQSVHLFDLPGKAEVIRFLLIVFLFIIEGFCLFDIINPLWYLCTEGVYCILIGGVLLSHVVSRAVPLALRVLTAVFGMGTGVSPSL